MVSLQADNTSAATTDYVTGSKEVTLIDEHHQPIGSTDIFSAHRHPAQLHLAPSVWLYRQTSSGIEFLMQQRSAHKPIGALWWGNTICGNVQPGETVVECAHRRLNQELSIPQPPHTAPSLELIFTFTYRAYGNSEFGEHELDHVYLGKYEGAVIPNPNEVSDTAWIPANDLLTWATHLDYPLPEATLSLSTRELQAATPPPTFTWQGQPLPLTPWTTMILRDERFALRLSLLFPHPVKTK